MRKRRKWRLSAGNHLDFFSSLLSCLRKSTRQNLNALGIFYTKWLYSRLISLRQRELTFHQQSYPVQENPHPWIDPWFLWAGTADTPADNAIKSKCSIFRVANEGATRTTLEPKERGLAVILFGLCTAVAKRRDVTDQICPRKSLLQDQSMQPLVQLSPSLQRSDLKACLSAWRLSTGCRQNMTE